MKEIWKDIFGFNGKYQISNFGNIRSKDKLEYKQQTNHKGYKIITLWGDGYRRTIGVHRLVALHFIPNPGLLEQVNHIDGNKTNNHVSNLEWCDNKQNQTHAYKLGLNKPHNTRGVIGIDKNGQITEFKSAAEAGRTLGINPTSIIEVCKKSNIHRHTAGGYKWRYK